MAMGPFRWPIFAMNASEAELAPVLKANFMQPVIQITNNPLVVDTGRERVLVDTGFGEKLGPSFGSFPGARGEPAPGRNHAGEHRSGRDVARSPGPYRRLGDEIGRAGVSEGSVRLCRYGVELLDRQPLRKRGQQFADARPVQEGHDCRGRENLPPVADRSRFVKQGGEITSGVHYVPAPGHSPFHAAILFTSGNEQFMHMGDIAHNPVTSLQHPDWTPVFDYDAAQAIKSRKAILDRVATDRVMVMGYHFPFPAIGHVVRRDTAYHWEAAQWAW